MGASEAGEVVRYPADIKFVNAWWHGGLQPGGAEAFRRLAHALRRHIMESSSMSLQTMGLSAVTPL